MSAKSWSTARLISVAVLLITTAAARLPAQDWIPFHVAGHLAPAGEWEALYPPAGARSLFDVSARYEDVARMTVSEGGRPAFSGGSLTAFVSSPPSGFATALFSRLSWRTGVLAWRLGLAVPMVIALLLVGTAATDERMRARWSWIALASTPLLCYVVYTGQASAWLLVAAALSVVPATRGRDIAGGAALGLAVIFKTTPLLVVVGLWLGGRRRLAAVAASVTGLVCLASLAWSGDAWTLFLHSAWHLAGTVITDWNNASFDAALGRLTHGATTAFTEPDAIATAGAWVVRIAVVGFALGSVLDRKQPTARRVAAAWVGWLASTPLLWLHYLSVLVPIAGVAPGRRIDLAMILVTATSALVVAKVAGLAPTSAGTSLAVVWLAAAAWMLSNRCWNPEWRRQS